MAKKLTADDVGWLIEAMSSRATALDELDLRWLGPPAVRDEANVPMSALDLPGMHAEPLGQRVVVYFLVMKSQERRNGIDGFVYNAQEHLVPILEGFEAVGAHGAVAALCELAGALEIEDAHREESGAANPVADFLAFRRRGGGPGLAADGPPPSRASARRIAS